MNKDESLDHKKQNILKRAKGVEIPDEKRFVELPEIFTRWFHHQAVVRDHVQFDSHASYKLAKKINANLDRCHDNCTNAMLHMGKYDFYTGYIFVENESKKEAWLGKTQHSWLVSHNDDRVIDPTLGIPHKFKTQKNGNLKRILPGTIKHYSESRHHAIRLLASFS